MPANIRHLPNSKMVRVKWGNKVVAKRTTMTKAKRQLRAIGMHSHK